MKRVYEGLSDQRPETRNLDPRAYIYDLVIRKIHRVASRKNWIVFTPERGSKPMLEGE